MNKITKLKKRLKNIKYLIEENYLKLTKTQKKKK